MNAFFISNIAIKDPEKFQAYAKAAAESMVPFGGEVVLKGSQTRQLVKEQSHPLVSVVRFPDTNRLNSWFDSPQYQSLTELRDEAADFAITAFESL